MLKNAVSGLQNWLREKKKLVYKFHQIGLRIWLRKKKEKIKHYVWIKYLIYEKMLELKIWIKDLVEEKEKKK